ncbi:MAG: valine--tRNA ligase, partial [Candidatus Micrarchaeota archaeon]
MADDKKAGQGMPESKLKEKQWNTELEQQLFEKQRSEGLYKFDKTSKKEVFVIDNPPVYTSGEWHIGGVSSYTLIDAAARAERMKGKEVLFPFSLDRNGINIERTIEKKTGKTIHEFDRQEFNEMCRKEISLYSDEIIKIAKIIGVSAEFDDHTIYYETDSPEYRYFTQKSFKEIWDKDLVAEQLRPNSYCPHCRTIIAEAEVFYEELPMTLNHMKWKVAGSDEEIEIATTRPELLCACGAVLFHPDDERYKHLEGKQALLPIYGRKVPIKAHPAAKPEFGSGILMVCSFGDTTDVQIFRELALKPVMAIDIEGKMTEEAGKYKGMFVKDARKAITKDMLSEGMIIEQEQGKHRSPICERSKTPVEIILLKEWYVKQLDSLDKVKKMADKMEFHPKKNKQILIDWVDGLTIDWPVSRRRYYHTEIPMWYCNKCKKPIVPELDRYYQPWKEAPPEGTKCVCGSAKFTGEERVFDTWVDSSITNLYVTGYGRDEELFKKAYPCALRPQGRDIVRTWLYYTLLRNYQLTGKPAFKHVMIHGMGLDPTGKKMSKSVGNTMHPKKILEKHGAEAFRLWSMSETNVGDDYKIDEKRIEGAAKFITKLWNVARFISSFECKESGDLANADRWILSELNKLVK